jgi:hypothetical protein
MSYSTETSALLAKQLLKSSTLNRHQLTGQIANLDFWLSEVRHCLASIDGYPNRFDRMNKAQANYVYEHKTIEFQLRNSEFAQPAQGPKRVPERELKDARRNLCDAASRFLKRCLDEKLIDESSIRKDCDSLGLPI